MSRLESLFMLAGEASADRLGAAILEALDSRVECFGLGGRLMMAQGLTSLGEPDSLATIGIVDAIKSYRRLSRLADRLIAEIISRKPDAVLTIDAPFFSVRFARRLRQAMSRSGWRAPIIHLVAPTVWSWGGWRAKSFARSFDHLLCLFSFEPACFLSHGGRASHVGHPVFDREALPREQARDGLGLDADAPVLAILPGSRKREIARLLPDLLAVADELCRRIPALEVILPVSSGVRGQIEPMLDAFPRIRAVKGDDETFVALVSADAGIMASGTVTLEALLAGLPGVVVYRPDPLTAVLGRFLVRRDRIVLGNVVAGSAVYPLYLGREISVASLVEAIEPLLESRRRLPIGTMPQAAMGKEGRTGFGKACVRAVMDEIARK